MANGKILTADQEMQLRQPIDDYVGKIQKKIDGLRVDGTDRVVSLQNTIDNTKRDRTLTKGEKENRISALKAEVNKAKAVEEKNRGEISGLIADAEAYLKAHYNKDYYQAVKASCEAEKVVAKEKCSKKTVRAGKRTQADNVRTFRPSGDQGREICLQEQAVRCKDGSAERPSADQGQKTCRIYI